MSDGSLSQEEIEAILTNTYDLERSYAEDQEHIKDLNRWLRGELFDKMSEEDLDEFNKGNIFYREPTSGLEDMFGSAEKQAIVDSVIRDCINKLTEAGF